MVFFFLIRDKFQNKISQQQRQSQSPVHSTNLNRHNVEVKKKVWSVDTPDQQQQPMFYHTNGNEYCSSVQQRANGIDVSRNGIENYNLIMHENLYFYVFLVSSSIFKTTRRSTIIT